MYTGCATAGLVLWDTLYKYRISYSYEVFTLVKSFMGSFAGSAVTFLVKSVSMFAPLLVKLAALRARSFHLVANILLTNIILATAHLSLCDLRLASHLLTIAYN
jgi:hypothetical protein